MQHKQLSQKKERPLVLGEHTPLSIAQSSGKWKKIQYLKDNSGMLPPNMIVVGDRRRVLSASKHLYKPMMLQLEAALDIDAKNQDMIKSKIESAISRIVIYLTWSDHLSDHSTQKMSRYAEGTIMECVSEKRPILEDLLEFLKGKHDQVSNGTKVDPYILVGEICIKYGKFFSDKNIGSSLRLLVHELLSGAGRVDCAIGIYYHDNKPIPLTILETQMGMSAQDINAWEQLVGSLETGYMIDSQFIPTKSLNVIRAGTCGGIIISKDGSQFEEPFITIGDVIIASSSIADGAVVRQRSGHWTPFDPKEINAFREFWAQEGLQFTEDGKWPVIHSSRQTIDALDESCNELKLRIHHGANMSKDSLYLEGDEERTMNLRKQYFALSTEMEHFDLAFLTHELTKAGIPATNGLVSTVVGTVPGGSFAEPGSEEEKIANQTQSTMLEAVMRSLWKLTYER